MHRFSAKSRALAAALLCAAALAACGGDEGIAAGCIQGPAAFRAALHNAPGPVRVEGARLSDCLSEEADGGELQAVGAAFVETASGLAPPARRRPEGREALELGYLVAAARQGGVSTQGVHSELLRRLDQELAGVDTGSDAFRRGERAARRQG